MDKKEEDQRMKELKDRYIRLTAIVQCLAKSQLRCAGGFSHGFSWREDYHRELLESEGNQPV